MTKTTLGISPTDLKYSNFIVLIGYMLWIKKLPNNPKPHSNIPTADSSDEIILKLKTVGWDKAN